MISLVLSFAFSLFAAWFVISPFYSKSVSTDSDSLDLENDNKQ